MIYLEFCSARLFLVYLIKLITVLSLEKFLFESVRVRKLKKHLKCPSKHKNDF